ncbi:site-specific integrase [Paenibacillus sp. 1011MAR3C5]|nr:site-specific integrase [Paenibacillus sp. 1011MAR3C5]
MSNVGEVKYYIERGLIGLGRPKKQKKLPPGVRERDGRFTFRYSVYVTENGKKRRKQKETESFNTPEEAYDYGITIRAKQLQGKKVDAKNITLEKLRDIWIEDYQLEREPRLNTVRNRMTATNSLINFFGGNTKAKDIDSDEYQRYLNNLKKRGLEKGTLHRYHESISIFFSYAVRKNAMLSNPGDEANIPAFKISLEQIESGNYELPKFLEKEQLKHFLNIVRFRGQPQEYYFFLILAYTGMRIGELLALKISDFNEAKKTISITKTLTVLTRISDYSLGPPKNLSSVRVISIGDTVIKAIKAQIEWQEKIKNDIEIDHDVGFLFWSYASPGYPASAVYLGNRFSKLLEIAELPSSLTPHSLRHTHVSLSASAGIDLAVIQERLGHKNDEITRRVYLHVTENKRKAAPDQFESIMSG